ncbi:MAG: DEAD/DEAH box helicase family protein [Bacteroidetes Order II. Incertae sedis bacterium]|nr:DEAD/DEAH box helicase family protein [Bacteroidetes Order II. bacterium]
MGIEDLFQRLKVSNRTLHSGKLLLSPLWFRLDVSPEHGGRLIILGPDKKPVSFLPDYLGYEGETRQVLKTLSYAFGKKPSGNDWGEIWSTAKGTEVETSYVIDEVPLVLEYLRHSAFFITATGAAVKYASEKAKLEMHLLESDEMGVWKAKLQLREGEKVLSSPLMVADGWVMVRNSLYEIPPLGPTWNELQHLEATLETKDIHPFLCILFSLSQHISLVWQQYETVWDKLLKVRVGLFFDKVDALDALYLRVSSAIPGELLPSAVASLVSVSVKIDDLESRIVVRPIQTEPLGEVFQVLEGLLGKLQRTLSKAGKQDYGFIREGDTLLIERGLAHEFVYKHLYSLVQKYPVFGAEKLRSYRIRFVTPNLDMRLDSGIDYLAGDVSLTLEGERFSLFDVLTEVRQAGYVQLGDGSQALINEAYIRKLERIFSDVNQEGARISFFDLPIAASMIEQQLEGATSLPEVWSVYKGFNHVQDRDMSLNQFQGHLRPYQEYGVRWMDYLREHGLGGCLADDMGLGKTAQAIALLSTVYPAEQKPSLVVMPTSLLFNWEAELTKFNPSLRFYTYYRQNRDLDEAFKHQLILTTYGMLRSDIEAFKDRKFHYVVLDESQNIKNLQTQATKAALMIKADVRLALSGTPIENNLSELYALFRFLNPAMLRSEQDFSERYATPIQKNQDEEAAHELKRKIYPFILRRLKREVAKELPDRVDQTLWVEMNDVQRAFYERRRRYYVDTIQNQVAKDGIAKTQFFIFQALNELRQIASIPEAKSDGRIRSPKRSVLMEQLTDAALNGHKSLIFTHYLAGVEAIGNDLEQAGIPYVSMTGATSNRQELVQRFQEDPETKVFVMTLKTGGTGLNLTAADHVFIFDPWWNTAAEQQAIDRTHRIGQDKTVFSHKLVTKGSIEEKIVQLQLQKQALVEAIISSDEGMLKSLSEDDILYIFGT